MAKVVGHEPKLMKRITCHDCTAIIEYKPNEVVQLYWEDGRPATDDGCRIMGFKCPECGEFVRTNH